MEGGLRPSPTSVTDWRSGAPEEQDRRAPPRQSTTAVFAGQGTMRTRSPPRPDRPDLAGLPDALFTAESRPNVRTGTYGQDATEPTAIGCRRSPIRWRRPRWTRTARAVEVDRTSAGSATGPSCATRARPDPARGVPDHLGAAHRAQPGRADHRYRRADQAGVTACPRRTPGPMPCPMPRTDARTDAMTTPSTFSRPTPRSQRRDRRADRARRVRQRRRQRQRQGRHRAAAAEDRKSEAAAAREQPRREVSRDTRSDFDGAVQSVRRHRQVPRLERLDVPAVRRPVSRPSPAPTPSWSRPRP